MNGSSKQSLRKHYRKQRDTFVNALNATEFAAAFSHAPPPLRDMFVPGRIVAGYVAIGSEADPSRLMAVARTLGCTIALPHVTAGSSDMRFLLWGEGAALVAGPFGLKQPEDTAPECAPDVVLMPLVAFDAAMTRLGQGAGHFDRRLAQLPNAVRIGIAWSVQRAERLPCDEWDVSLHAVLTQQAWVTA